ncbi:MAG: carbamoyl-phosphate synthase (glutamine-hydrolyzing) [Geminicoccaceae bacterium]|nr:carbamoyl-phosphate synthase (glutamine-hydrolyzing) [Geminicoccaceae bacterium]
MLEIIRVEASAGELVGVIVQLGGQTPLKLAKPLADAGVPILGTSPDAIDLAEDRERFQQLLRRLGLSQPANDICSDPKQLLAKIERLGYPVVLRPSYVLGGQSMRIVHGPGEVERFTAQAGKLTKLGPILIDRYLQDAIEVDVDVVADGGRVFVAGVMEHIEEAGIHSGDSACSLPPYSLPADLLAEIRAQAEALARALEVRGLMNVQMAIKDREVFILEVNPRASRTVPFVAKAIGRPIAKIAARVMAGEGLDGFDLRERPPAHVAVKEAVFPFARFPGVDLLLGPEMKSTGEVMGLDRDFGAAFAKSQLAAGNQLPEHGTVFISVRDRDKPAMVALGRVLLERGYQLIATRGTAEHLRAAGLAVEDVNKVFEGRPHVVDRIKDGRIVMVLNTTEGQRAIRDSYTLRRAALVYKVPYYTTVAGARAVVQALVTLAERELAVAPLQSYYSGLG